MKSLPMAYMPYSRSFAEPADLVAMVSLLTHARPAGWLSEYPGPGDLAELLSLPPERAAACLWRTPAGALVAYAIVDSAYHNLYFDLAASTVATELPERLVDWAAGWLQDWCASQGTRSPGSQSVGPSHPLCNTLALDTSSRSDDHQRIALLRRTGFEPLFERTRVMARWLHEPIEEPFIPLSFLIRPAAGVPEVDALVALHRAAFGTETMTVQERLVMMQTAHYEAALDLVAEAPTGELAAYCFCGVEPGPASANQPRQGYTDPVATHPRYRRLGLARALMLTGLGLLRARGVEVSRLGTSSANQAMQRLALAAGYRVEHERLWYARRIHDPATGRH